MAKDILYRIIEFGVIKYENLDQLIHVFVIKKDITMSTGRVRILIILKLVDGDSTRTWGIWSKTHQKYLCKLHAHTTIINTLCKDVEPRDKYYLSQPW